MSYQFLTDRRDGPIDYLTLNRPDVRNAFNDGMIAELTAWAAAAHEAAARASLRKRAPDWVEPSRSTGDSPGIVPQGGRG
jgi:enoyl-CoA hydratase/carnithine racemase